MYFFFLLIVTAAECKIVDLPVPKTSLKLLERSSFNKESSMLKKMTRLAFLVTMLGVNEWRSLDWWGCTVL